MQLRYSAWATRRVLESTAALSSDELSRDLGASYGGVLGSLKHIYQADSIWFDRLMGAPTGDLSKYEPSADFSEWLPLLDGCEMGRRARSRRLGPHRAVSQWERRRLPNTCLADRAARSESRQLPSRPDHNHAATDRPRADRDRPDHLLPLVGRVSSWPRPRRLSCRLVVV